MEEKIRSRPPRTCAVVSPSPWRRRFDSTTVRSRPCWCRPRRRSSSRRCAPSLGPTIRLRKALGGCTSAVSSWLVPKPRRCWPEPGCARGATGTSRRWSRRHGRGAQGAGARRTRCSPHDGDPVKAWSTGWQFRRSPRKRSARPPRSSATWHRAAEYLGLAPGSAPPKCRGRADTTPGERPRPAVPVRPTVPRRSLLRGRPIGRRSRGFRRRRQAATGPRRHCPSAPAWSAGSLPIRGPPARGWGVTVEVIQTAH